MPDGKGEAMKLGVIGAMEVEVDRLTAQVEGARTTELSRMRFVEGTLRGLPAVVVRCGVGKVNAAVCAQLLADRFGVTHVVNTGVAGSLDDALDVGDILVSTDAVHHDVDATNFGYRPGEVPGMGMPAFPADGRLRQAALAAARAVAADSRRGFSCFEGRVASGDRFVRDSAEKERIARTFHARCCEMEGAAIAQTCWLAGTPFVIVRAISDRADGSNPLAYPLFERRAARDCARIVLQLAGTLAAS